MMLELKNVTHFFGHRLLFKDVNVRLEKGKIFLIKGKNGSGKSTFLKIIAGLLTPTQGQVVKNVSKSKIAYLGHVPFFYSYLNALENLLFFANLYSLKLSEAFIKQKLNEVGLSKFIYEPVKNYSRGMKQRLNLARLFLLDAELLLLDEPETGLDKEFLTYLYAKIKGLAKEGKTIVWISHLCDFQDYDGELLIEEGRIISNW
ncbi:MAG: ATP-binding cassette domain-containing protein [Desulfonauticus sp.]|nr:ATP-binding cassette domain-containing protein [Desulfonauticus sp.]